MTFTVVTGTHNHRETLPKLYETLRKEKVQWLICDDGSSDGTWEYITQLSRENGWIEGFSQTNRGMRLARSLNHGFRRATGDVTIVIMGDTYLEEGALDWLRENYIPGSAGCGVRHNVDKDDQHVSWDWILEAGKFPMYRVIDVGSFSSPWASLTGNSLICPTKFIKILDGWDEHYEGYGRDDWDFFLRLQQIGVPLFNYTGFIVNHLYHGDGQPDEHRNILRFEEKREKARRGENVCAWL